MPLAASDLLLCELLRTDLKTDWDTTELPMVVLVAWSVVLSIIEGYSESSGFELVVDALSIALYCLDVIACLDNWNDDDLSLCHSWRQDEALVV